MEPVGRSEINIGELDNKPGLISEIEVYLLRSSWSASAGRRLGWCEDYIFRSRLMATIKDNYSAVR